MCDIYRMLRGVGYGVCVDVGEIGFGTDLYEGARLARRGRMGLIDLGICMRALLLS